MKILFIIAMLTMVSCVTLSEQTGRETTLPSRDHK